jgi:hypothetical protein
MAIQTHLGHSSIQLTLHLYGHLFPDEMNRLAEHVGVANGGRRHPLKVYEPGPSVPPQSLDEPPGPATTRSAPGSVRGPEDRGFLGEAEAGA